MSLSSLSPAKALTLFTIIVLEGYVVLSSELLAIRQTIPFAGSGTDTISIIIAAVLMPLAFGYYAAGRFRPDPHSPVWYKRSVRGKLLFNITVASVILLPGLSHILIEIFFATLIDAGVTSRIGLIVIYSGIFLVVPVYLLAQTIPLVSCYFGKERVSKATGRILFYSTLGSFLGAVFSTLVLMSTIGVHNTASLNFIILALLAFMISRKKLSQPVIVCAGVAAIALFINADRTLAHMNIVENNQYNLITVHEDEWGFRNMIMNHGSASRYRDDGQKHAYIMMAERVVLQNVPEDKTPLDILILGAGAFTFGSENDVHNFTFVDIDSSLKEIAEKLVLQKELGPNKVFNAEPARAFLKRNEKKYDVIYVDAYRTPHAIPEHLLTKEFFEQVRQDLKQDGLMLLNAIDNPYLKDAYTKNLDNTIRHVFPHASRHNLAGGYPFWSTSENTVMNTLYVAPKSIPRSNRIYTDNLNTIHFDKPSGY